jgi:hypothetical protein
MEQETEVVGEGEAPAAEGEGEAPAERGDAGGESSE